MHPVTNTPDTAQFMLARGWSTAAPTKTPAEQPRQPERWEIIDRLVFRSILVFVVALATVWGLITPAVLYGPEVIPTALFPVGLIWAIAGAIWFADKRQHPTHPVSK